MSALLRLKDRKGKLLAVVAVALMASFAFAMVSSASVAGDAGFQDADANLIDDGAGIDWNSFGAQSWSGTAPYRTTTDSEDGWSFKGFEDASVSTTDTGFAGGVKQDSDCGTTKDGKAPNKDDLKRIYLATKTVNGDVFLMLSWVRIPQNSTTASAHVGYEFNQGGNGSCGGSPTLLKRKGGDMLVIYDFEGGSSPVTVKISRWLKAGEFAPAGAVCEVNNSSPANGCWGGTQNATDLGFAEGKVTLQTVTDDLKPSGATNPGPVEFGEAGINLTDAGIFSASTCSAFGSAYAVSRSSGNSSQAAMEDIVGPGSFTVSNCATVAVTKTGSDGGSQDGAVFTLYSGANTSGTVIGSCTVTSGTCSPSFTNLQPGQYTIDETTVPAGYNKDPNLPYMFMLAAGDSVTLPFVDQAAPGTVSVTKVDDAGAPVVGATFTLFSPQGISSGVPTGSAVGSCTTGMAGTCSITGVTPGLYTIDETTVPLGYAKDPAFPQNISVGNGATVQVNATNPRQFKMIVLVCLESTNTLYSSSVTINGDSRPASLTSAGASSAGLSESTLCGLTAGAKGGLLRANNPQSASVMIPASG